MRKRVLAILSGVAIVASTLALVPDEAEARFGGGGGGFRGGGAGTACATRVRSELERMEEQRANRLLKIMQYGDSGRHQKMFYRVIV